MLHVSLGSMPWGYNQVLKELLRAANHVTDLILELPRGSHIILKNLHLNRLILFKANLPHGLLLTFLRLHPRIEHLDLGPCKERKPKRHACPLAKVALPFLWALACPPTCMPLGNATIRSVTATYRSVRDLRVPVYRIFQSTLGFTRLTVLHIDFDPADSGLLRCIAEGAPSLTALKLTEICHTKMVCRFCSWLSIILT